MDVPISFPFERDKSYPIGDLRRFPAALSQARGEWRRLKDQGRTISYWRESDEGAWEQAR